MNLSGVRFGQGAPGRVCQDFIFYIARIHWAVKVMIYLREYEGMIPCDQKMMLFGVFQSVIQLNFKVKIAWKY